MSGKPKPIPMYASTRSVQMEQRRMILRKALQRNPGSHDVKQALIRTLELPHLKRAAERGVFISYHRNDELFALELDQDLRSAGVKAWLDVIDIPDAEDWHGAVQRALRECGVMLFVLSPDSVADKEAQLEREHFIEAGKVIIPLLYQTCNLATVELVFVPPVDFRHDYQVGLAQLRNMLTSSGKVSV